MVAVSFLTIWIQSGLGRHLQCLEDPRNTLLWALLTQVLSLVGICLIKTSVCLCIRRIVQCGPRLFRYSILILLLFIIASHTAHLVFLLLQCRPLDVVWSASIPSSNCFTRQQLSLVYYIGYSVEALTDLICASLPIAIISRGRLSSGSRIAYGALIGFGILITGCAIFKTVTLTDALTSDYTWESTIPVWFTIAEYYGGIVAASIPSLVGLFARSVHTDKAVYHGARDGGLRSAHRKGNTWARAGPRKGSHGVDKKHFSISTFGMSEGEVGSRVTIVDNRFTVVVEDDGDRLTCVAEEADEEFEKGMLDNRSTRTATWKNSNMGWNQEDVFSLRMLGKDDPFSQEDGSDLRGEIYASYGRSDTPKRASMRSRPTAPKALPIRPLSGLESPKSPDWLVAERAQRTPTTLIRRSSTTSSTYSPTPASSVLASIPSPPTNSRDLPFILEQSWRYATPGIPKTPTSTTSPSGFRPFQSPKTPHNIGSHQSTGFISEVPQGAATPGGRSIPAKPKRPLSVTVPRSKFQADMSEEQSAGDGNRSEPRSAKSRFWSRAPLEMRVVDIAVPEEFDSLDATY